MNFKQQQNILINFIKDNYKDYLPAHISEPEITTEFLDFDKFKGNFTLFIDFTRIDFRQSNYEDDCRDVEHLSAVIYLVNRNNPSAVLNELNLDSTFAFYKMVQENLSLGISLNTTIDSIDFYKYTEGNKYLVVSEINLSFDVEI
jgi:hypothetical protein